MNILDIDRNMKPDRAADREGIVYLDVRKPPFRIYGVFPGKEGEQMTRLPIEVAEATSAGVAALNFCTAGGRVRFSTDSPYIAVYCEHGRELGRMDHFAPSGSHGADLYLDGADGSRYLATFRPGTGAGGIWSSVADVGGSGMRSYTLNLPLYAAVRTLKIGLKAGCRLEAGLAYRNERPVVYYGSSITQGGCASRPGMSYQAMISAWENLDYLNLGFSGSARGEEAILDYMAGLDPLIFVSDYDHNAPSAEHLEKTCRALYEKVRARHPDLPYLFVSAPLIRDGVRQGMREVVRKLYGEAVAAGDKNVAYLDGGELFAGRGRDLCTVDGCHPNDLGFFRMAEAIGGAIGKWL